MIILTGHHTVDIAFALYTPPLWNASANDGLARDINEIQTESGVSLSSTSAKFGRRRSVLYRHSASSH